MQNIVDIFVFGVYNTNVDGIVNIFAQKKANGRSEKMTNTALLKDLINKSGLKIGFIADYLGISRQLLWRKINNLSPFNQYEIDKLCEILKITNLKVKEAIFFAKM